MSNTETANRKKKKQQQKKKEKEKIVSNINTMEEGGGVGGWGCTPQNHWKGVCRPVLHILTLFQTKTCHFPHPF